MSEFLKMKSESGGGLYINLHKIYMVVPLTERRFKVVLDVNKDSQQDRNVREIISAKDSECELINYSDNKCPNRHRLDVNVNAEVWK